MLPQMERETQQIHRQSSQIKTDSNREALAMLAVLQPHIAIASQPGLAPIIKRMMDVMVALVLLIVLAPLLIGLAIAIKLNSSGPVLFTQNRVGKGGRIFRVYKFRSMITNSEALKLMLEAFNDKDGPIFKMHADPRITDIGRFMRRHSLDELPQLYNVLTGDMSLVGPRPPLPSEVVRYEPWQLRRLAVKPGLTCTWQTSGRSKLSFEEWMRMDLDYIDSWTIGLDIKLLLKTIKVVINADGAY
jgi:lipopolysaccharide/colanic/teichoic acid biosynthesis glycosyltransferase